MVSAFHTLASILILTVMYHILTMEASALLYDLPLVEPPILLHRILMISLPPFSFFCHLVKLYFILFISSFSEITLPML